MGWPLYSASRSKARENEINPFLRIFRTPRRVFRNIVHCLSRNLSTRNGCFGTVEAFKTHADERDSAGSRWHQIDRIKSQLSQLAAPYLVTLNSINININLYYHIFAMYDINSFCRVGERVRECVDDDMKKPSSSHWSSHNITVVLTAFNSHVCNCKKCWSFKQSLFKRKVTTPIWTFESFIH
jgi:hypothetical protein